MKNTFANKIIEEIKIVDQNSLDDILDAILDRLYQKKKYTTSRIVDGHIWHVECLNPHARVHFTND